MRRQLQGASAEEEGMSHYENLVHGALSIMYYFGKYDLVSSIIYKTSNGSPAFCMEIPSFSSIKLNDNVMFVLAVLCYFSYYQVEFILDPI
jgi:hypothetical protein